MRTVAVLFVSIGRAAGGGRVGDRVRAVVRVVGRRRDRDGGAGRERGGAVDLVLGDRDAGGRIGRRQVDGDRGRAPSGGRVVGRRGRERVDADGGGLVR